MVVAIGRPLQTVPLAPPPGQTAKMEKEIVKNKIKNKTKQIVQIEIDDVREGAIFSVFAHYRSTAVFPTDHIRTHNRNGAQYTLIYTRRRYRISNGRQIISSS